MKRQAYKFNFRFFYRTVGATYDDVLKVIPLLGAKNARVVNCDNHYAIGQLLTNY